MILFYRKHKHTLLVNFFMLFVKTKTKEEKYGKLCTLRTKHKTIFNRDYILYEEVSTQTTQPIYNIKYLARVKELEQ